jgi:hypothetical protein
MNKLLHGRKNTGAAIVRYVFGKKTRLDGPSYISSTKRAEYLITDKRLLVREVRSLDKLNSLLGD